jgi:predicted aldo/keto reductase-like oxidoreductase
MPILTLGGMRHMHSWKDLRRTPRASQANVEACMRRAWELGINHFETARGYGTSELEMGRFIRDFPRDELILQTKVTPREDSGEFARIIDECLRRLRVNHFDLLAIHGVNNREMLDRTVRRGGCLDVAMRLRDAGIIRHIGFSTHGPLELILETMNTGAFDYVNLHFYYFNQRNLPAVRRAGELDMGVLIISPQEKGGMLFRPPERLREAARPLHPMTFNSLWTLGFPEVSTLTIGAAKSSDLDDHVRVLEHVGDIPNAIRGIPERIEEAVKTRLGATLCTFCHDCLPCPEEIQIPEALRLRNLLVGLDMEEFGKYRYNLFERGGHWFPGKRATACTECGDCLPRCPEHLDIPRLLFETHEKLAGEPVKRLGSQ